MTCAHQPTDEKRQTVRELTMFGHTQKEIADYLCISVDTLDVHYREELNTAVIDANRRVANRLFARAVDKDDLEAQKFWLRTRGGKGRWVEQKSEETNSTFLEKLLLEKFK